MVGTHRQWEIEGGAGELMQAKTSTGGRRTQHLTEDDPCRRPSTASTSNAAIPAGDGASAFRDCACAKKQP